MCVAEGYTPAVSTLGTGCTPIMLVPGSESSANMVLSYPTMPGLSPCAPACQCSMPLRRKPVVSVLGGDRMVVSGSHAPAGQAVHRLMSAKRILLLIPWLHPSDGHAQTGPS